MILDIILLQRLELVFTTWRLPMTFIFRVTRRLGDSYRGHILRLHLHIRQAFAVVFVSHTYFSWQYVVASSRWQSH